MEKKLLSQTSKIGQQATVIYDDGLEVAASISASKEDEGDDEALKLLQGEWIFIEGVASGKPIANQNSTRRIVIKGDNYMLFTGDKIIEGTIEFDETKSPKHLNWIPKKGGLPSIAGKVQPGICELTNGGNTLRFCVGAPEGKRPTKYDGTPQGWSVQTFEKRDKEAESDEPTAKAMKAIQGEWLCTSIEERGKPFDKKAVKAQERRVTIKGNTLTMSTGDNEKPAYVGKFEIDAVTGHFDFIGKGRGGGFVEWIGVYEVDGDSMKLCYRFKKTDDAERITKFKSDGDDKNPSVMHTYKRDND